MSVQVVISSAWLPTYPNVNQEDDWIPFHISFGQYLVQLIITYDNPAHIPLLRVNVGQIRGVWAFHMISRFTPHT